MKALAFSVLCLSLVTLAGCGEATDDPSVPTAGAPPAPEAGSSDYGSYQKAGKKGPPSAAHNAGN